VSYLADTSAWHHSSKPAIQTRWIELLSKDAVWVCDQVALEVLYSARSAADYVRTAGNLDGFRYAPITPDVFKRARSNQSALAHSGRLLHADGPHLRFASSPARASFPTGKPDRGLHHRSVTIADLVIAASAEAAGLTVLHYDEDYDRIAAITNQPTEWIAPRGSL
jgi:predicted nucleic acid-binding protein